MYRYKQYYILVIGKSDAYNNFYYIFNKLKAKAFFIRKENILFRIFKF